MKSVIWEGKVSGGKDLRERVVLIWEWKSSKVMNNKSEEFMEGDKEPEEKVTVWGVRLLERNRKWVPETRWSMKHIEKKTYL